MPSVSLQQAKAIQQFVANRIAKVYQFFTWKHLTALVNALFRNMARSLWVVAGILIVIFVAQNISGDFVTIEPISVPKTFSEDGYTPQVAGQHLRDALNEIANRANSSMQHPNIALRGELPNITVPKVELSLDTIISSIRSLLHYGNRRTISGEFTSHGKFVWLHLRIDGREVYKSPSGFDPERPDDLLAAAAPAVMEEIQPYLVAAALYDSDPTKAMEKVDGIIARLPESNVNAQWALMLKGNLFARKEDHVQSEKFLRKAIGLNPSNWAAHDNLGITLFNQSKYDDAIAEFRRAIEINPKHADAYMNLGAALSQQSKYDDAIAEFRRAIEIDPKNALIYYNLGIALFQQGKLDDAIAEFRRAIEIDPKRTESHISLGVALRQQGKLDDAIAEFRRAIEIDPKQASTHNNLGVTLHQQGKLDDAIAEYRRAIEIDPKHANARSNLELALRDKK
jgi:tetratricopeptide (TPR) repeat protein